MPAPPPAPVLLHGQETLRGCTLSAPLRLVDGPASGTHRVRRRGRSHDFRGYRAYAPGDPVRDVDWRVFGRTDKLFLRQYEDATDLTLHLALDASASMGWAGWPTRGRRPVPTPGTAWRRFTKLRWAAAVAALLAAVGLRQRDRVELIAVQRAGGHELRRTGPLRGAAAMGRVLQGCEALRPAGQADLGAGLRGVGAGLRRRALVVLFTDALAADRAADEAFSTAVRGLTAQGHAVLVAHTLHAEELDPPDRGATRVRDAETGKVVRLEAGWGAAYAERVRSEADALAARVRAAGGACRRLSTGVPPWEAARAICEDAA